MSSWSFEILAVLLIILVLGLHRMLWAPPPAMSRDDYVRVLVEAGTRGTTPRRAARALGFSEDVLGRAAHNYGDLETERRVAEGLRRARAR